MSGGCYVVITSRIRDRNLPSHTNKVQCTEASLNTVNQLWFFNCDLTLSWLELHQHSMYKKRQEKTCQNDRP